jgi:hypothetical protein
MGGRSVAYVAGACVLAVGVLFLIIGSVFMLGSQGKPAFLLVGLLMVVLAIAGGIFTLKRLGRVASTTPDAVDERVLNLATMSGGEVTAGEVAGALQISPADAQAALERLVSQGMAEHKVRDGDLYYAFPGIATVRKIKRCAYCGTEYPLREPGHKCSSCGGALEVVDAAD